MSIFQRSVTCSFSSGIVLTLTKTQWEKFEAGVAEGVRDWSDHLRKITTRQLLGPTKILNKTSTANGKMFGSTKVRVVGPLPPAL